MNRTVGGKENIMPTGFIVIDLDNTIESIDRTQEEES